MSVWGFDSVMNSSETQQWNNTGISRPQSSILVPANSECYYDYPVTHSIRHVKCYKRRRESSYCVTFLNRHCSSIQSRIKSKIYSRSVHFFLCFLCCILPYASSRDLQGHVIEPLNMSNFVDIEIDVTPAPVTVPPVFPPTRRPTRRPTRNPTLAPTVPPITNSPTTRPTIAASEPPSFQPSARPSTLQPTFVPSARPSFLPSLDPTDVLSREPSMFPSFSPSRRTNAPSVVVSTNPSVKPSSRPSVNVTDSPIQRNFVNVSVPIGFAVDLKLRTTDTTSTLKAIEGIWEEAILSYFMGAFSGRPGIQPSMVDLSVTERTRRSLSYKRIRRGQQVETSEAITVETIGDVDFSVDEYSVDPDGFVERATEEIPMVINSDMLQQAIDESDKADYATVVSEISDIPESPDRETDDNTTDSSSSREPTTAQIVFGFTLLIFTLASLVFWAHVLWKKRKKQLRQRRLEALRKMQSVTYRASSLDQAATPKMSNTKEVVEAPREISAAGKSTTISPVQLTSEVLTKSETYDDTVGDEEATTDESDPFARELRHAASLDRVAWEESLRSKEKFASAPSSVAGVAGTSNVSIYDVIGNRSQDVGIEVEPHRVGSFPYGDENHNQSKEPVHLNSSNAVKWTAAGISLMPFASQQRGKDKSIDTPVGGFSPYGDTGRAGRSLEESWDLDEFPVKEESGPSRFSFLYPLKRRDLNADVPDARRSPVSDSSVREDSVEVTSVGTPEFANSNLRDLQNEPDDDIESDDVSQSAITAVMLKELDDIANFVKEHEKMKRSRASIFDRAAQNPDVNDLETTQRNTSLTLKTSPETGLGRSKYTMKGVLSPARSAESSLGLSDEEDDDASQMSQRLGISRISVEKPATTPSLTYKNSQDDPLRWEMDTSDLSPFPSNDFDSLRYSPSHSFDNKQMTINFAKESLLDGALPIDQSCITEDSDDINSEIPGFANQEAAAASTLPTKAEEMHRYLRRSVQTRQLPKEEEEQAEVEPRVSPRVRSTDRKYNTIRSMFESKRTPPIVPPNESVRNSRLSCCTDL